MQSFWLHFLMNLNSNPTMKSKIFYIVVFLLIFQIFNAQKKSSPNFGMLTPEQFTELKEFLLAKNLVVKDTLFLKYDFNKENCWDSLDGQTKEYIEKVTSNFQNHIINFNAQHKDAVAYNLREPGTRINKLKLWDKTIIIDDLLIIKNLLFQKKKNCGTSVVIFKDRSYYLHFSDPHFELLEKIYKTN